MILNIVELFRVIWQSISSVINLKVSVPGAETIRLPLYFILAMGVLILGAVGAMVAWVRTHK